jgi:hypothetical protein
VSKLTWLSSQVADFFGRCIQKLILRYKCLSSGGDYAEMHVFLVRGTFCVVACLVNSSPEVAFQTVLVIIGTGLSIVSFLLVCRKFYLLEF